jgi:hypothetical protein
MGTCDLMVTRMQSKYEKDWVLCFFVLEDKIGRELERFEAAGLMHMALHSIKPQIVQKALKETPTPRRLFKSVARNSMINRG